MSREELKEIVIEVMEKLADPCEAPLPACVFSDNPNPCDVTTFYAVGEEG